MKINLSLTALVAFVALALVSAPISTLHAAAKPPKADKKDAGKNAFGGPITAIDTTASTVTLTATSKKNGDKSITVNVTSSTKITKGKKALTLADLKVGDQVTGSFTKDASGTLTATTLSVGGAKEPKAPKAPKTPKATAPAPAAAPAAAPATN